MTYAIEMINITKRFGPLTANNNINLQVKKGEIHALLGENGAGKSTLVSILFGLYQPDEGMIRINGKEEKISNPNVANALNIGMVHQHFKLVESFTVLDNIILGIKNGPGWQINRSEARKKVSALSDQYGLNVDLDMKIQDISVGMQQRVEILKMLYRDAEYMIFDEPSAVLTPQEIDELILIIKQLSKEGKTILIITHKLDEIKAVADRCTIIRRGEVIDTVDVAATSQQDMANMMVGKYVDFSVEKKEMPEGEIILDVKNLKVKDNRHLIACKDLTFNVRRGEIVGIAGVDGSGQNELVQALTGLRKVESGQVFYNGGDITHASIRNRVEAKISHIPQDRHKYGLVLDYTLANNIVLLDYYHKPFSKSGLLNDKVILKHAEDVIKSFDIRSSQGATTIARTMSGGNQQKAIVGREIEREPNLLIAAQPTRGLDIGAIQYIHSRLLNQRDEGKAVLLVSLELDEILKLSDRIIVMYNGEIMEVLDAENTDEQEIGLLMTGIKGA